MIVSWDYTNLHAVAQFELCFLTVNSRAAASSPVAGEKKTYQLYIIPPRSADRRSCTTEAEGMRLSLDILNFDPSDEPMGSIFLDSAKIESALNPLGGL